MNGGTEYLASSIAYLLPAVQAAVTRHLLQS
jgi:hypothetical protein